MRHFWVSASSQKGLYFGDICAICNAHVKGPCHYPDGTYAGKENECSGVVTKQCDCSMCKNRDVPPKIRVSLNMHI